MKTDLAEASEDSCEDFQLEVSAYQGWLLSLLAIDAHPGRLEISLKHITLKWQASKNTARAIEGTCISCNDQEMPQHAGSRKFHIHDGMKRLHETNSFPKFKQSTLTPSTI